MSSHPRLPAGSDDFGSSSGPSFHQSATVLELQAQMARQRLMIQTLAHLLVAKGLVTEQELNEWMRYVDGLDGTLDGRLRDEKTPMQCPQCRRMNPPTAVKCQYCGSELPAQFVPGTPA